MFFRNKDPHQKSMMLMIVTGGIILWSLITGGRTSVQGGLRSYVAGDVTVIDTPYYSFEIADFRDGMSAEIQKSGSGYDVLILAGEEHDRQELARLSLTNREREASGLLEKNPGAKSLGTLTHQGTSEPFWLIGIPGVSLQEPEADAVEAAFLSVHPIHDGDNDNSFQPGS